MENIQAEVPKPAITQEEMLQEILENSRKTKSYMKWQLYITIILVVLPLLASIVLIPMAISGLSSVYGTAGLLQ
ncbi:MAG TPA: hypothetical protein VE973_00160 [Candidatus Limnocylindria bacterium]|nr:hypothetical protein [Candidatus Limnocylindria bacterium]